MRWGEKVPLELVEILYRELSSPRPVYPEEHRYTWLPVLLDIYHLIDVWARIDMGYRQIVDKISCHKGCSICCRKLTIPISGLEFSGLSWYVAAMVQGQTRLKLKSNMIGHHEESGCPFLIDNVCGVYPLRPSACRQFFMTNAPCRLHEGFWTNRKNDIYCALNQDVTWMIGRKILSLYGIKDETQQHKMLLAGFLEDQEKPIELYNWREVGRKISI